MRRGGCEMTRVALRRLIRRVRSDDSAAVLRCGDPSLHRRRRASLERLLLTSTALAAGVIGLAATADRARAVDNTWQAGGVANTNYNATTNWDTGTVPASAGNSAIFGAAGSATIVVNAPVAPDSWTFNAAAQAYTITGAQVTFGGAGLIANTGNDISIANALAGIGGVTKTGAGVLTLTGALSYTGLTTVSAGSLILGDATRSVTLPGNATVNGGNLDVANGSLGAGTITSTGTAIVVGLTPGLAATAGSSTINNGGTLTFMNSGSAGTAQIANTGVLDFADTSTAANATITTSGGGLAQIRDNASAGNSTFTTGNGTSLTFAGNASGGAARLIVDAGGRLDISLVNTGVSTGSIEGAGDIFLGSKNLTVGGNNLSTPYSGVLQDGGVNGGAGGSLTKTGTGTLTLSGTNTYTGATTVNGGTLSVTGSVASSSGVTVNTGATLGGTGTVATTVVNSGGTLAPGTAIGTLTVNGNLTLNTGSNYNVDVSPVAADRTNVTGTATLNGSVNANYAAGSYVSTQYTILNATGGRVGTFSGLANSNIPANLGAALSYDANNVYLNLTLIFAAANTDNQRNVGNALTNFFNTNGGIPGVFVGLSAGGLTQASGEAGTGAAQSGIAASGQFVNAVMDSAFDSPVESCADGAARRSEPRRKMPCVAGPIYAAAMPKDRAGSFEARWNVWAAGYGGGASVDGDNATGSNKTTSRIYGAVAGATYRVSPLTQIGFALGGAGSSFSIANGLGSGKADMFNAAIYAKHMMGPAYVAAALGYTWQDASTDRTVTIAGTDVLHAGFHPQALTGRLDTGRRYVMPAFGITPYAALQTTTYFMPSYGESATSGSNQFALSYASKNITATRGELGARFDKAYAVQGGIFTLKAKTAWAHDWNTERTASASFQALPGTSFTVNGARPSADAALLSLGGEMDWGKGWRVAANVDGEFASGRQSYAAKGSLIRA